MLTRGQSPGRSPAAGAGSPRRGVTGRCASRRRHRFAHGHASPPPSPAAASKLGGLVSRPGRWPLPGDDTARRAGLLLEPGSDGRVCRRRSRPARTGVPGGAAAIWSGTPSPALSPRVCLTGRDACCVCDARQAFTDYRHSRRGQGGGLRPGNGGHRPAGRRAGVVPARKHLRASQRYRWVSCCSCA